ncbi:MAG: hypothetical protein MI974_31885 [Chitinophagales bacterium]|nr:hypothetical protein [Chitinophagales bacterium]
MDTKKIIGIALIAYALLSSNKKGMTQSTSYPALPQTTEEGEVLLLEPPKNE